MPSYRRGRINEETVKELSNILRDIKDPRVADNMVSVTAAEVSPDLKSAKIYFSAMTGDKKEIKKGLVSAAGFIRKRLAETMNLRVTPELFFEADDSIEYGARINTLLKQIERGAAHDADGASDNESAAADKDE